MKYNLIKNKVLKGDNNMKKTSRIILMIMLVILSLTLVGCREAERVSHNVSQEADNFNVIRRLTVINARTDKPMFELIGAFSDRKSVVRERV